MTNIIEWDEKYSVDEPELDECRKQLMDMFNTLIEIKTNKGDTKDVANLITDINDFSKIFFKRGKNSWPKRVS